MNAPRPPTPDEERRRVFRRMEWVFVWAPPLLILFVAVFGGAFLAFFIPVAGTSFYLRWGVAAAGLIGIPLIGYLLREFWERR